MIRSQKLRCRRISESTPINLDRLQSQVKKRHFQRRDLGLDETLLLWALTLDAASLEKYLK